ncbi:hypothetical protein QFZ51_002078 [Chitinophaga sp. W3I9]|uniref:hypothetical protein n=1 Tax=unclassified Chitinophaga TaxID=2619133 RepID=UPI003D21D684
MKIRNIVFALLLLSGISVSAQRVPVQVDIKLKGEWQVKSVTVERYHMKQGHLLGKQEITAYDSITTIGGGFLNIVFREDYCIIKQSGGRNAWDYIHADSGRLELKPVVDSQAPSKETPEHHLRLQYSFGSNGDLFIGPMISGYMDRSTGVPVKMKYTCHYTRIK